MDVSQGLAFVAVAENVGNGGFELLNFFGFLLGEAALRRDGRNHTKKSPFYQGNPSGPPPRKLRLPPRNSRPYDQGLLRVYENPLVSLNKAGKKTPYSWGGVASGGVARIPLILGKNHDLGEKKKRWTYQGCFLKTSIFRCKPLVSGRIVDFPIMGDFIIIPIPSMGLVYLPTFGWVNGKIW